MNILDKLLKESLLAWGELYHFSEDIEMIFSAQKKIVENAENFTEVLAKNLKTNALKDLGLSYKPKNHEEESCQAQYYEHYYGGTERAISQILENQRKAAILSIFSLIEGQLKILCELIQNEFELKIKLDDLDGRDYIQKYWLFLTKVYEIDKSQIEAFYTPIKQQKYVRNKIAHNNSSIDAKKIKSIEETQGLRVVSFNGNHELQIADSTYVENLLKNGEDFFQKIVKLIDDRYMVIKTLG